MAQDRQNSQHHGQGSIFRNSGNKISHKILVHCTWNSRGGGGKQQLNHHCYPLSIICHLLPPPYTVWLLCLLLLLLSLLLLPLFLATAHHLLPALIGHPTCFYVNHCSHHVVQCLPPATCTTAFNCSCQCNSLLSHLLFDCCFFLSIVHHLLSIVHCQLFIAVVVLSLLLPPMPLAQPPCQL